MRLTGLLATALSLTAGAALACPDAVDCGRMDHHRHAAYERGHHRPAPPPCFEGCGEVSLPASFFHGSGGVGPIPDSGWYGGGGFVFVGAGAGAGANASAFAAARASAHASANVSIRYRGGWTGHKGGKRH